MLQHRKRRRRGVPPPARRADVPAWLHAVYSIPLTASGQPKVEGLALARERAAHITHGDLWTIRARREYWSMHAARAAGDDSTAKHHHIQALKAELAAAEGRPFPRTREAARAVLVSTLRIETAGTLPLEAAAHLCWMDGYDSAAPTGDSLRALRRLMSRHW